MRATINVQCPGFKIEVWSTRINDGGRGHATIGGEAAVSLVRLDVVETVESLTAEAACHATSLDQRQDLVLIIRERCRVSIIETREMRHLH